MVRLVLVLVCVLALSAVLAERRPKSGRRLALQGKGRSPEKSSCSFGFCPNYLEPQFPLALIWTTCTTFF